jgi:hypothetical protein
MIFGQGKYIEDFFDSTPNWYRDFLVLLQQPRGLCAAGGVYQPRLAFLTTIVLLSDDLDRLYELCLSCFIS